MSAAFRNLIPVLLIVLVAVARAEDAALSELHTMLAPLRHHAVSNGEDRRGPWNAAGIIGDPRSATPALMPAKRVLRDWIESHIARSPENVRERLLAAELNGALRRTDLYCWRVDREDAVDHCAFEHEDWN